MIREDFDRAAMDQKIADNLAKGFTEKQILEELLKEQAEQLAKMGVCEARIVELEDQAQYIREKYGINSDRI
jgi:hypothetical protein